jgi:RNA polymerase sigma-70 factor (ECF subfamily)
LTTDWLDAELVVRSQTEPSLFAEIFDRHHAELYRYVRHRVGPELAPDLVATTFVTAFGRRAGYVPQGANVLPWLQGIAHELLRNHPRREPRQYEFVRAGDHSDTAVVRSRLAQALVRMPADDRDVLLLVAWGGMSQDEVAQSIGIPTGTVRFRLQRARRRLLQALADAGSLDVLLGKPMDEIGLLRNFHRDVPGPSRAETSQARAPLLAAIANPRQASPSRAASAVRPGILRHLSRPRVWAPLGAAAAVAALLIAFAPGPLFSHEQAGQPAASSRALASVLNEAAAAAALQPVTHGQYFVSQFEVADGGSPAPWLDDYWDGNGIPYFEQLTQPGKPPAQYTATSTTEDQTPLFPVPAWAQIQHLPTAPGPLLDDITKIAVAMPRLSGEPMTTFNTIVAMLTGSPASPRLRSALFRVLARLPGLRLVADAQDLTGGHAAEVYLPAAQARSGMQYALFFDPAIGAPLGAAQSSATRCQDGREEVVLTSGYVGSEGDLPAGALPNPLPVAQPAAMNVCSPPWPSPHPTRTARPAPSRSATPVPSQPPVSGQTSEPGPTQAPEPTPSLEPTPTPSSGPEPTPTPTPSP